MQKPVEPIYKILGARVQEVRQVLDLTQEELAARTTLTRASIANLECGRQRVLLHQVEELATALGMTPRGLMNDAWLLRKPRFNRKAKTP